MAQRPEAMFSHLYLKLQVPFPYRISICGCIMNRLSRQYSRISTKCLKLIARRLSSAFLILHSGGGRVQSRREYKDQQSLSLLTFAFRMNNQGNVFQSAREQQAEHSAMQLHVPSIFPPLPYIHLPSSSSLSLHSLSVAFPS
ncbi:hypothetical protein FRC18_003169 [Serendipita sp. 400]|nr:hypothetical protein FRC18_003169 [Serendipita sp. 400]